MKMEIDTLKSRAGLSRRWLDQIAFTLTEVLISSAILSMIVLGAVTAHLVGINMYQMTKAKLGASDEARSAVSKLVDEIRAAKTLRVGNGGLSTFTQAADNTPQIGNCVQIYMSTNTNNFIRYFWDSSDKILKRTTNGSTAAQVVANFISNNLVFSAEDHLGNVITNPQNNRVIGMNLEFFQIQYPIVTIGPGGLYDYYGLSTRITRRALE